MEKKSEHPSHESQLSSLNRIKGQIEGIKKMIQEKRYCPDILTQLLAARSAIKSIELKILDSHLSSCISKACFTKDQEEQRKKIDEIRNLLKKY